MSLEAAIKSLEEKVVELTAAITNTSQPSAPDAPKPSKSKGKGRAAAASKQEPADAPPPPPKGASISDVQDAVMKLVQDAGRDVAIAALKELGVTNARELDESQYADALAVFAKAAESAAEAPLV